MLYFVSTPIGNLKDITLRAIDVLKSVDYIACEDKKHSLPLLNAYDIKKPLLSYQKFNESETAPRIIELLKEGKDVAVISDAGTPVLSDPGAVLCKKLKEEGIAYTVIPGANALLPALILSAFDCPNFAFIGFLPPKKAQIKELLSSYENLPCPLVFYCAPHDLEKTVALLYEFLGNRRACAIKEITKIYESATTFSLKDGLTVDERGEFVIVVEGVNKRSSLKDISVEDHIKMYIDGGMDKMTAIKTVAKERGVPKSALYKYTIDKK